MSESKVNGRYLHQKQYIYAKVFRDKFFIKNKKRPILEIMKDDYAKDPKLWGDKLFGGKTVKELCEVKCRDCVFNDAEYCQPPENCYDKDMFVRR